MKTKFIRIYRIVLSSLVFLTVVLGFAYVYKSFYDKIPQTIVLETKKEQTLSYDMPVSGTISLEASSKAISEVSFRDDVTLYASKPKSYVIKTKLFGLIPLKSIDINVVDEVKLIPIGVPVGVYADTEGLLVVQTGEFEDIEGNIYEPSKDLIYEGDYIMEINGVPLESKYELVSKISESKGEVQTLTIERDGNLMEVKVIPRCNEAGEYKLGIWVKDNAQGIGTLTYVTQTGEFGALGHGIIDLDIQTILRVSDGNLYKAQILGIRKGEKGSPGEMSGVIFYGQDTLGDIEYNYETGIYGEYDISQLDYLFKNFTDESIKNGMEIAYKNEIKTGDAQILCTIDNQTRCYDIHIDKIYMNADNINKSMKITVTDEELLKVTGGIVQGMSGSPILQNGRIVGAVTHVLVNDPTRGYGIFIEDMLEH